MSKIHFFYGTVNAAKSAELLMKAYYLMNETGLNVKLYKPNCDSRDGMKIKSRIGIEMEAKNTAEFSNDLIFRSKPIDVVFIDEVQFMTPEAIEQIIILCAHNNIQLFCYGLRTDFKGNLFPAIEVLMAHATHIEEIKSYCACCGKKKAIYNARLNEDGSIDRYGDVLQPGFNYKGYCFECFNK